MMSVSRVPTIGQFRQEAAIQLETALAHDSYGSRMLLLAGRFRPFRKHERRGDIDVQAMVPETPAMPVRKRRRQPNEDRVTVYVSVVLATALGLTISCGSGSTAGNNSAGGSSGASSGSGGSAEPTTDEGGSSGGPGSGGSGASGNGGASAPSGTGGDSAFPASGGSVSTSGTAGASGGAGGNTGDSASQSCAALAKAGCSRTASCSSFLMSTLYGDASTCEARLALSCAAVLDAPGTAATPALMLECAQSLGSLACPSLLTSDFGPQSLPWPGPLATGSACGDDSQCATAFCARGSAAICGVCAARTAAGSPCVRNACSVGTICPDSGSTCIVPTAGKVGASCKVQQDCDLLHGVGCNTSSGSCMSLTVATNNACGLASLLASSYAVCPASGTCSASVSGKCAPAAADGAACDAQKGPACLGPARCVSGKCTLPNPTSCQ